MELEQRIRISRGHAADYIALERFHYRPGAPATIERVLTAREDSGLLAGVLVISRPVLNASWRRAAWPGRFATRHRRDLALEVNESLRCISRVVVDPRFRGLSLARRLVREYLDDPLTPLTEALAAMGAVCPFFAGAGMREVAVRSSRRDQALRGVLRREGIESWRLLDGSFATRTSRRPRIRRALERWARASRSTRDVSLIEDGSALASLAGATLYARPRAYAWP